MVCCERSSAQERMVMAGMNGIRKKRKQVKIRCHFEHTIEEKGIHKCRTGKDEENRSINISDCRIKIGIDFADKDHANAPCKVLWTQSIGHARFLLSFEDVQDG